MACSYYYYHHNSTSFFVSDIKDRAKLLCKYDVLAIGICTQYNTWELYTRLRKRKYNWLIKEIYYIKYNKNKQSFD